MELKISIVIKHEYESQFRNMASDGIGVNFKLNNTFTSYLEHLSVLTYLLKNIKGM